MDTLDNADNKIIELLYIESVIKIYIDDNKLYLVLYEKNMEDNQLLQLYETLEMFYEVCKKKNKRFFFVIDFRLYNQHPTQFQLLKKCVCFLNKHRDFYEKYKISTICIVDCYAIKIALNVILKIYTPVRPFVFFNTIEEIVFDTTL